MNAFGPNLRKLLNQAPGRRFSKTTIYKIIISLVERLRTLHEIGYVHNDLKLDNIVIGNKDPHNIYLIDFGVSSMFWEKHNGLHIEKKFLNTFTGNFLFASLNSCRGNNKSRRDDIESLMYLLVYMLCDNTLPWE